MGFLSDLLLGTEGQAQKKNEAGAKKAQSVLDSSYAFGESSLLKGLTALDAGKTAALGNLAKYGQQATNQILASKAQTDAANSARPRSSGGCDQVRCGQAGSRTGCLCFCPAPDARRR